MSYHDDMMYLRHIYDAIRLIRQYTAGVSEEKFTESSLIQDGVIRQLEIIGEATKRLSNPLRRQYSEVPWQDVSGMRDKLIHDYFGVDIKTVWLTVKYDIPELEEHIKIILSDHGIDI